MTDFVKAVRAIVPIAPYDESATQGAPYATYLLRETPLRTKDGIAGYEGTLTLSVYSATIAEAERLARSLIERLDRKIFDGRTYYYADVDGSDFPDMGLVSKDLTFNTLQ
jgi:hypothetical protein